MPVKLREKKLICCRNREPNPGVSNDEIALNVPMIRKV